MTSPLEISDLAIDSEVVLAAKIDICGSTESGEAETDPADDQARRTQLTRHDAPWHWVETALPV